MKPICEIQFSGFIYQAFHQFEQQASRIRQRSRGEYSVPMVCRAPYGGEIRALEHHSESREAYFAHTPGLKVVIPSNPYDAKGLLLAAIKDPDPVIYYEPKRLYRSFRQEVPLDWYEVPIGQAKIIQEGADISIFSWGACIPTCEAAIETLDEEGVEIELVDLRTISPLDTETIVNSIKKTQRAVIVHEAPQSFGPGAEIIARICEKAFFYLKAPIKRVAGYDVHMPYFSQEKLYVPDPDKVVQAVQDVMSLP
jgi:pyruvate dehydrogenase E1 component beta subunit